MPKLRLSYRVGLSLSLIILTPFILYRGILNSQAGITLYPWGSDTLGHELKVGYLQQNIARGVLYPNLLPQWYLGQQMMRYYPPLPYYLIAGLSCIVGNAVAGANLFIVLCAVAGGLAWLTYRRWLGWLPALAGGILFTYLPDNVRVALSEGNLPRVLATAILPFALYFLLRSLEADARFRHRLALILCFAAIVLCHAMMAAIYAVCFMGIGFFLWLGRSVPLRRFILATACLVLGMLLSGWWLIPSLKGGITALDSTAMTEALAVFSIPHYLNPTVRVGQPETSYIGAALLLFSLFGLFFRVARNSYTITLTLTGLAGVLITTPGFNQVFNSLPLHGLLWPLRFLGIASLLLLLALLWSLSLWPKRLAIGASVFVILVAADGAGSLSLIHLGPLRPDISGVALRLASSPGWREATLDFSRLGSSPSMFFTSIGEREQVFGWAYQGASTARTASALNEAAQYGFSSYLRDRLDLLGVDDVVLLRDLPMVSRVANGLIQSGFHAVYRGADVDLYHRDGSPRAVVAHWPALGIGFGAQNLAYLFPEIILGTSTRVDDYTLAELSHYQTIVLSGFQWRHQASAETLIKQAAEHGINVVVDLTGSPPDPSARIPHFMGIWGEQIILGADPLQTQNGSQQGIFQPFSDGTDLWHTFILQGLQNEIWSSNFLGQHVVVAGYNQLGAGRVWFIGLNLPFHAFLTQDPLAIQILKEVIHPTSFNPRTYQVVPLQDYRATQNGYHFEYSLDTPERLLLPLASLDGLFLQVDGRLVSCQSLENMIVFDAPAGQHEVSIAFEQTWIYSLGWLASGLALIGVFSIFFWERRQ
jgi:uncharacterized membrane protein